MLWDLLLALGKVAWVIIAITLLEAWDDRRRS